MSDAAQVTSEVIDNLLAGAATLSTVVIGDVMLDQYLEGTSSRNSPEAPVPILDLTKRSKRLGGAANVALNLIDLCDEVHLLGLIGEDQAGVDLLALVERANIQPHLIKLDDRKTTVKTRLLAGETHLLRVDDEDRTALSIKQEETIVQGIRSTLEQLDPDLVLIQDYNKGMLTPMVIRCVLSICQDRDIPVAVDPKFEHITHFKGVDLFKPNFHEFQRMVPFEMEKKREDLDRGAQHLRGLLGFKMLIVTLSDAGIYVSPVSGKGFVISIDKVDVVDVCGAGDAVIAVAALAEVLAMDPLTIAKLSNYVGGIVCSLSGVHPISKGLLLHGLA